MRASVLCLALILATAASSLAACGGAIAPQTDDQQSTTGTGKTTAAPSRGTAGSDPGGPVSSGAPSVCSPGAYVFCRCADRSEGTKLCRKDGSFDACSCDETLPEPSPCAYPPTKNPPGCPASYSSAYQGQPCSPLNLDCAYPGAGDFDANGCAATAGLWCRLGAGGNSTVWFATQ